MVRKRKSKKSGEDIFDKLRDKTLGAKEAGSALGKLARERGGELGKQITAKSKEGLDKGISTAKSATVSKKETVDLIEKLGSLKDSGYLTEKEFQQKKKELLAKL